MTWWEKRRVLVTGGAGFIGSNLVQSLLAEKVLVRVVDNLERGRREYLGTNLSIIDFRCEDLLDPEVCRRACEDVDVVIHLASKVGGISYYLTEKGEVFRKNVAIDNNMWSAALDKEVPYYFYASSAHVYPIELQQTPNPPKIREEQAYPASPSLSYGWAKLLGEKLIQFSIEQGCRTRASIARIIGAYGPNQDLNLATGSAIPVFCRRAVDYPSQLPFMVMGTGAETRSYHYVTDTVDAILRSVAKLSEHAVLGPFNLGSEELISIRELAQQVIAISGKSIEVVWDTRYRTEIWGQVLDCSLMRIILDGWRPAVSLNDGLQRSYDHIRARLVGAEAVA